MRPSDEVESSILGKGQKESFSSLLIFFFTGDGDDASLCNNFCVTVAISICDVFLRKGEEGTVENQYTIDLSEWRGK